MGGSRFQEPFQYLERTTSANPCCYRCRLEVCVRRLGSYSFTTRSARKAFEAMGQAHEIRRFAHLLNSRSSLWNNFRSLKFWDRLARRGRLEGSAHGGRYPSYPTCSWRIWIWDASPPASGNSAGHSIIPRCRSIINRYVCFYPHAASPEP